jgi:hypothetical protein
VLAFERNINNRFPHDPSTIFVVEGHIAPGPSPSVEVHLRFLCGHTLRKSAISFTPAQLFGCASKSLRLSRVVHGGLFFLASFAFKTRSCGDLRPINFVIFVVAHGILLKRRLSIGSALFASDSAAVEKSHQSAPHERQQK